jgi:hypothetical protein
VLKYLAILLFLSAFLSITLMQGLIVLMLLLLAYRAYREPKLLLKGKMALPLHMYIASTLLSTLLFLPKMALKAVGEGLFQLLYFIKPDRETVLWTARRITPLAPLIGIILLLPLLYHHFVKNTQKVLWGGNFEVGNFYSIFAFGSLFMGVYEAKRGRTIRSLFYFTLFALFLGVVIYSTRRSALLSVAVLLLLCLLLFYRNGILGKRSLAIITASFLLIGGGGYLYLSKTDPRFKTLNRVLTGKEPLSWKALNWITSSRANIFRDAAAIIERDIRELKVHHLLIGHGVRSGVVLPHKFSPPSWQRYESVFVVSEFVEKGLIGVIGELLIIFIAFRTFLMSRVTGPEDLLGLFLMVPLLLHLVSSIFTFFWDALLPLYFLMFRFGEEHLSIRSNN